MGAHHAHPSSNGHPRPGEDVGAAPGILGLGTDLCAVERLARELAAPERGFVPAVFSDREQGQCGQEPGSLASFFAAKEAVIKSMAATGEQGTFWQDIEITRHGNHHAAALKGRIRTLADTLGVRHVFVSAAQDGDYATACAIITR